MKADALCLAATLNNSEVDFYTIPQYQRPYTWEIEQYDTLWEDLIDAFDEYQSTKDTKTSFEYYFVGPVVFVKNKEKKSFDIIDGQQRITTFHIILWYLYHRINCDVEKARLMQILTFLNSVESPKLKVSSKDISTFHLIRNSNKEVNGVSKMVKCANYFREKISSLKNPEKLSEFLRDYIQFIVIIADDYSRAWDLFIGINGKGEHLNPTDLVKAFVCGVSDIGEDIGNIWEEKILPLKDLSTSFLLFLSRFKGEKFVSENALFKDFSKLFPDKINKTDLITYSEIFYRFWLKPIDEISEDFNGDFRLSNNSKKFLRMIRDLRRRDFTTLLFQFAEAYGQESIFDESFLKLIISYQIRLAISRRRSRERKFITWMKDFNISSKSSKEDFIEQLKLKFKSDAPDDTTFENYILLADYGNFAARILIQHMEEGIRGYRIINEYQLEHLMPQKGTDYWYNVSNVINKNGSIDQDIYSKICNNIGNLFLIDPITNNNVKNREYNCKKKFYQEHLPDWSIARITNNKDKWDSDDINERSRGIATWAKENFEL